MDWFNSARRCSTAALMGEAESEAAPSFAAAAKSVIPLS